MTVIAASVQTLSAGSSGTWFDVTGSSFMADVDSAHTVTIETRRGSGDTAPKKVGARKTGADSVSPIIGPCGVLISSVAGRQYRFVAVTGPASVAADQ